MFSWFKRSSNLDRDGQNLDTVEGLKNAQTKAAGSGPTCKICCACPMQRRDRDECVLLRGMENCATEIDSFYKCLLTEGFSEKDVATLKKNTRAH